MFIDKVAGCIFMPLPEAGTQDRNPNGLSALLQQAAITTIPSHPYQTHQGLRIFLDMATSSTEAVTPIRNDDELEAALAGSGLVGEHRRACAA